MDRREAAGTPHLSVIIPCYNEATRLPASLSRVREYLTERRIEAEILIVDDGSADETVSLAEAAAAEDPRVRVLRYGENRGKGFAVAYGALRARGEWVLFSDADLSTPIEELEELGAALRAGSDVAIASRALSESVLAVRQPWYRERLGRTTNFVIRQLLGLSYADTQCGFKLFSRAAAQDIFYNLRIRGWLFDVEALLLAQRMGYRVAEVPVTWVNSPESRVKASHLLRTFRELWQMRRHWQHRDPERHRAEETEVAAQPSP